MSPFRHLSALSKTENYDSVNGSEKDKVTLVTVIDSLEPSFPIYYLQE
jgi:hypothetical protein